MDNGTENSNTGMDGTAEETGAAASQPSAPEPATALEEAIVSGQSGAISNQDVITAIWNSELLSVGRLTVEDDPASFQALVLKSPEGAAPVAATFTDAQRIPQRIRDTAPIMVKASGEATLRSIAPGYGLAINPGNSLGLELGPEGVQAVVAAFGGVAGEETDSSEA
ncbi:SseB family protein [Arthrobacter koreensis]|uniref:SseB family protein n=1 Tax=Arthrobacter koreensis TaxID=199136 RepID=A0ABY6FSD9_9MICC|nr:SseB family protein [Arthrobacter koreensis]UYB35732.1 SseB family protein [Arthrobacter koreensis]